MCPELDCNKFMIPVPYGNVCVYFVQKSDGEIKIGRSTCLNRRLYKLRREYGELVLLGVIHKAVEWKIHSLFHKLRKHSEWFEPSEDLLDFIKLNAMLG